MTAAAGDHSFEIVRWYQSPTERRIELTSYFPDLDIKHLVACLRFETEDEGRARCLEETEKWGARARRNRMTTAAESHDAQLAAIKVRHEAVRAKFNDPAVTFIPEDELYPATIEQMGLHPLMVDSIGRFWRIRMAGAEMVFDPGPRNIGYSHGDRDNSLGATKLKTLAEVEAEMADPNDTQAAQGFKAHE